MCDFRGSLCAALFASLSLAAPIIARAEEPLDLGFRQMYNLEFDEAHQTFAGWKRIHPEDPMGAVSDAAAYLFAELDRLSILQGEFFANDGNFKKTMPLTPKREVRAAFDREIGSAERLARAALGRSPVDKNALFANILAFGLRSDYDALIEKRYISSLAAMKNGRLAAEKLIAMDSSYYDAYIAVGLENYLLSQKPAPMRFVLRLTGSSIDKEEGLRKLRLCADRGHYLKPFARLLLAVAALRDKDIRTAKAILQDLARQFPRNRLYTEELARLK